MSNTQVRELIDDKCYWIKEDASLKEAAKLMAEHEIGALPICSQDGQLRGVVTDRDITLSLAEDHDPDATTVETFADGKPITIGADDSLDEAIETMKRYKVRRLPVIDGQKLVGLLSQGDIASYESGQEVGELVSEISETTPNSKEPVASPH